MKKLMMRTLSISLVTFCLISCAQDERRKSDAESGENNEKVANVGNLGQRIIPGVHLRAFLSAHEAFLGDEEIPAREKVLQNYQVSITEESKLFKVYFLPRAKPGEETLLGGQYELGRHVYYLVDPKDFKIVTRKFLK